MWFGIFIVICIGIIVYDTRHDAEFRKKLDEVEE